MICFDQFDFTPFHYAVVNSNFDVCDLMVQKYGMDVNIGTLHGELESSNLTPLMACTQEANVDAVKWLIRNGANVNIKTAEGFTALMISAEQEDVGVMQLLLEAGADVTLENQNGHFAVHVAACSKPGPLRCLLEKSKLVDVNVADHFMSTPFHFACAFGFLENVKLLYEHGAKMNVQNDDGTYPLYLAITYEHVEVVKFLLSKGCQVDVLDANQNTPLHIAAGIGNAATVDALLDAGVNIFVENDEGFTADQIADMEGHRRISSKLRRITTMRFRQTVTKLAEKEIPTAEIVQKEEKPKKERKKESKKSEKKSKEKKGE